jgi:thymidylate synthase ThyX
MKLIDSSVEILEQAPGILGLYKHIEQVARVTYKSEDKITDDSYVKFLAMLDKRGHWAPFDLGTVYMRVPLYKPWLLWKLRSPWTKMKFCGPWVYITTTYRIIHRLGLKKEMERYWFDHKYNQRITSHWICSRGISHELVRHKVMCPMMESTRYCLYSGSKFGGELTYIIPQWVYDLRDELGNSIDPLTSYPRNYLKLLSGRELWDALCCESRLVASRDKYFKEAEVEYLYEVNEEELKPEDARGVLPQDIKTELYLTGYLDDYIKKPEKGSNEKLGFFYLRTANDAHPDIRVLAKKLEQDFRDHGLTS